MYEVKKILSHLPVMSFTDDENFGELKKNTKKSRFSLLRISIGIYKFYFFTYLRSDGFKFFKKICLYDIQKVPTDKEAQNKAKEYALKISGYDDRDVDVHIEALQYKMSQLENTMTISLNKIMFYYVVLMGLSSALIAWIMNSSAMLLFQGIMMYCLANIWLFSWEFIKIGGWPRFAFKELKESKVPKKKFAESIYYEWYFTRNQVPVYVSYVKNIEKYFLYIALVGVVITVFLFAGKVKHSLSSEKLPMQVVLQDSEPKLILNFSLPFKEILNEKNIDVLRQIQSGLTTDVYSQIILVRTAYAKTEVYDEVFRQLMFYNINKTPFAEIVVTGTGDNKTTLLTIVPIRRER
jgi:hypothetical protein